MLRTEALKAAVAEAKRGRCVARYDEAREALGRFAPKEPETQRDGQWIDNIEKHNKAEGNRLESELKGYKNNLIKESIRVGGGLWTQQRRLLTSSLDWKRGLWKILPGHWRTAKGVRSISKNEARCSHQ